MALTHCNIDCLTEIVDFLTCKDMRALQKVKPFSEIPVEYYQRRYLKSLHATIFFTFDLCAQSIEEMRYNLLHGYILSEEDD